MIFQFFSFNSKNSNLVNALIFIDLTFHNNLFLILYNFLFILNEIYLGIMMHVNY